MDDVTGTVYRDINSDGTYRPGVEPGVPGISLTLTDDSGNVITTVTGADGSYGFDSQAGPLTGGRYRLAVEPGTLPAYLKPARVGGTSASFVNFVNVSAGPIVVNIGVHNPAE